MSEDKIKVINPGFQQTYRIIKNDPEKGCIYKVDVTCLRGDTLSRTIEAGEEFTVCDEFDRYKSKTFLPGEYSAKPLQTLVMKEGQRCDESYTLAQKKAYHAEVLSMFSPSERRLINPHYYKVDISDDLYNLKNSIINRLVKEIKAFKV